MLQKYSLKKCEKEKNHTHENCTAHFPGTGSSQLTKSSHKGHILHDRVKKHHLCMAVGDSGGLRLPICRTRILFSPSTATFQSVDLSVDP